MCQKTFCLAFLIFILSACGSKPEKNNDEMLVINMDINDLKTVKTEDVFSAIELVMLENLDDALFNRCDKMCIYQGKYYILDKKSTGIFVFDESGRFLKNSKHKEGMGPGEYYFIADFDVWEDGTIEILDTPGYKIRRYDNDFNFIGEVKLSQDIYPISSFKRLTDDLYAFHTSKNKTGQLIIYSFKEEKVVQSLENPISNASLNVHATQYYSFYDLNEEIYFFFPCPSNKIYRINYSDNVIEEHLAFDFGEYGFPYFKADSHSESFDDLLEGSNKYAFPTHRYETDEFILTLALYKEKHGLVVYKKDTKETRMYSCSFDDGKMLLPPVLVAEDVFYVVAESGWLEYMVPDELKDVYGGMTEDDNYVIVKYHLKKTCE